MLKWLAIGAAALVLWAGEASAQMKGLDAARAAGIERARPPELRATHNVRIAELPPLPTGHAMKNGMLVSRDVAPNAMLGLGLVRLGNRKSAGSIGISGGSGRRKPAVTFVLHF